MQEIETSSPEETFQVGKRLGEEAQAGQVYTLVGDLGVGKTVLTQGVARGLGLPSQSAALHLRLCRYMKRGGFPFTILTSIGLQMWMRWRKSDMRIIFMGKGFASLSGGT